MGNRENVWAGSVVISSSSTYSDSFFYSRPNIHTFATQQLRLCKWKLCFLCSIDWTVFFIKTFFLETAKRMLCHFAFILICFYQKLVSWSWQPLNFRHRLVFSPEEEKSLYRGEHHCKTSISSVCVVKCVNESCVSC